MLSCVLVSGGARGTGGPVINPADLLKEGKLKEIVEKADQVKEAAEKTADAIENLKEEIAKHKKERQEKMLTTPDSARCPNCKKKQDSAHIDDNNPNGTFKNLKDAKETDHTKDN
jgi:hypothetical protein